MIKVKRLGHATFSTPDLERQIEYWTDIMGLSLIEKGNDHCFLGTKLGQEAIALERGEQKGALRRVAFQVAPGSDLGELAAKLRDEGIASEMRSDISPGVRRALVLTDPKDTLVEIYADYEFAPEDGSEAGVSPIKFGHVAYRSPNLDEMVEFYCKVLGMRVSDWIGDHFTFLRCGIDHHTMNFARADEPGLIHIAFEVKDVAAVLDACNYLTAKKVPIVWGPLRHTVGHNVSAYHRNPDYIRVETFAELDVMLDEELGYWEPRPWHEERPLRPRVWPKETLRSQWNFGSHGTFPDYP